MMINLVILLVVLIVGIVGGDGWMLASEEDGVSVEGLVPELVWKRTLSSEGKRDPVWGCVRIFVFHTQISNSQAQ